MHRSKAATLAQSTLRIVDAGGYSHNDRQVSLSPWLEGSLTGTVEHRPDDALPAPRTGAFDTLVEVHNESTLDAALSLHRQGFSPAALNFASAKNPGGGFLNGARAQEESLARSSALYACLSRREMYAYHRSSADPLYSHWAIFSPQVPVFRDDESGDLLPEPFPCGMLTCAAVNAGVALERGRVRRADIEVVMRERIERVLTIFAAHRCEAIVLGAWGCGVFQNDPATIARLFAQALGGPFAGTFARVRFAILDWSSERRFIGPFEPLATVKG